MMNRNFDFRVFSHLSNTMDYNIDEIGQLNPTQHYTAMQLTGLKAKNGADVYEGDIVEYGTPFHGKIITVLKGYIVYNVTQGAFQIAYKNISDIYITDFCHKFTITQVLGNIFQNPELL